MEQEFGSRGNLQGNQRAAANVPPRAMPRIIARTEDERYGNGRRRLSRLQVPTIGSANRT
jgi:hypothetical protein